ncbi:MAG: NTP transferase domain-containing protein [Planctomycetia bacterium]|nr:NTP transferase domain-containing protein [Planctomycetia bacterium]
MVTALADINAYILNGGQSRRFNMDKSLVQLNGQTLTEIIYQKLGSIFNNIYIVGKENQFPDFTFIKDIRPVQCQLNGIVTALEHSHNDWIFVIACDLPVVETSSINDLYDNINSNTQVVLPNVNDNLQPLCAFYHKSVLKIFNAAIGIGDYSLMKLLDQIEVVKVIIPSEDEEQFLNINYPEDLKKAEDLINLENTKWTLFKT